MNFFDYALQSSPKALFKLNSGGTDYADISGNGATKTGTPVFYTPIVSGSAKSWLCDNATRATWTPNVFKLGREFSPFTLECVALPVVVTTSAAPISILSHSTPTGPFDGISMDNDKIFFSVKFTAGVVTCSWSYPDFAEAYHIVAEYTPSRIGLKVNGELVAEATIPETYPISKFNHGTDTSLFTGICTGAAGNKIAIDAVTVYQRILEQAEVQAHFDAVRDVCSMRQAVWSNGGGGVYRDGTQRNIFQQNVFGGNNGWPTASLTNVGLADGYLRATESYESGTAGQTLAGTWIGSIGLDSGTDLVSLAGIKMEWNADGTPTVQVSLDGGSTYTTVTNGELIPTSQGLNPTGKSLYIKVTFASGVTSDTTVMKDMTVTAYRDNYIYGDDYSRPLQIQAASGTSLTTALEVNQPIERNARMGFHFNGDNSWLRMYPDATSPAFQTKAFEFWVRPRGVSSGTGAYLLDNRSFSGGTFLQFTEAGSVLTFAGTGVVSLNGSAVSTGAAYQKDRWNHIIVVLPSAGNTDYAFGTNFFIGEIGMIAVYPTDPVAATLYASYYQVPVASFVEPGTPITIAEPATPYVLPSLDFATLGQQ